MLYQLSYLGIRPLPIADAKGAIKLTQAAIRGKSQFGIFGRIAVAIAPLGPNGGCLRLGRSATGNAGRQDLLHMLTTALCTVLFGGGNCVGVEKFAPAKLGFSRVEQGPVSNPGPDGTRRAARELSASAGQHVGLGR